MYSSIGTELKPTQGFVSRILLLVAFSYFLFRTTRHDCFTPAWKSAWYLTRKDWLAILKTRFRKVPDSRRRNPIENRWLSKWFFARRKASIACALSFISVWIWDIRLTDSSFSLGSMGIPALYRVVQLWPLWLKTVKQRSLARGRFDCCLRVPILFIICATAFSNDILRYRESDGSRFHSLSTFRSANMGCCCSKLVCPERAAASRDPVTFQIIAI